MYIHRLNPFVPFLQFTETFGVRWYGLSYVAGFVCAYAVMRALARRGKILIKPETIGDLIVALAAGTVIGGRLGYCLLYRPGLFIDFSASPPFWGVLAINEGGMASHGGIVGLIVACLLFARKHHVTPLHLIDVVALTGTIGVFFGRIANFINGELYGRECSPTLPWAVKFPQEMRDWSEDGIGQLAGVLRPIGLNTEPPEALVERAIAAIQKGNVAVTEAVAPLLTPRHPSQIYEALLEGLFLFIALWLIWKSPRKPGVIGGWFLVLYPVVRILGEGFRTPDAHLGFGLLGLTRGQWLSVIMLVIGITCLIAWARRPVPRIGGWGAEVKGRKSKVRRQNK